VNPVVVENLFVRYPGDEEEPSEWVLKDVSFTVGPGEFVILSGFSGVGKSTLLYTLNGVASRLLNAEVRGVVEIFGEQIAGLEMGEVSWLVGSVLQDPHTQIFNLKVDDELAFGLENFGVPPEVIQARIENYARLMGLSLEGVIERLSGGEVQRLAAAAVLAMQHRLVLLDEPLANMDVEGAQTLLNYLKGLTREGKAVILVEHRLDVVLPYCTRLLWMEDGVLVEDLPQSAAFQKYTSRFNPDALRVHAGEQQELIRFKRVSLGYRKQPVLEGLDLAFRTGEAVVILGENGSGKTTLLRGLGGLSRPLGGMIEHSGSLLNGSGPGGIGFVYQNPNYMLFMDTVFKEVHYQSEDQANTEMFLELFRIAHLSKRHPLSLSEGQKRLVTIAAIAAMKPALLLLDEPTVGQDYHGLEGLLDTLEILNRQHRTCVVLVTHDFRCASAFGERILWLGDGTIKADGGHKLVNKYFQRNLE
jgi:energy-coupling factor transporter ATP-binding protein EcfA2